MGVRYFIPLLALVACKNDQNPSSPEGEGSDVLMRIDVEPDSMKIGVGISNLPLTITAAVTKDASGETAAFSASAGAFSTPEGQMETTALVGLQGEAAVIWYPSDLPGRVRISASVDVVTETVDIEVTAVPPITLVDLPATMQTGAVVLFEIVVDSLWARKAVEVSAPLATLRATGPVEDGQDASARIRPILDSNGTARVLLEAPSAPMQIVVTVSLFGTVTTQLVDVT